MPANKSRSTLFTRILLLLVLALTTVAVVALRLAPERAEGISATAIGHPAPQIDLVLLSGDAKLTRVLEQQESIVTLLHCWGTWCGPCRMEYPDLAAVALELERDYDFQFLSISCEGRANETLEGLRAKTQSFLDQHQIGGAVYADPMGITRRSIAERLGQQNLYYPTSVLICPAGNIVGVWEGYTPESVHQIRQAAMGFIDH